MIARMIEAVRMFAPFGVPCTSFAISEPGAEFMMSGNWTFCANQGARTNRPHMP